VMLAEAHPLAGAESTPVDALAAEQFLMFPRDLAPRLHDFMVGLCRRGGFEPQVRSESFHTGWEIQILGDAPAPITPLRRPATLVPGVPESCQSRARVRPGTTGSHRSNSCLGTPAPGHARVLPSL
jgi:DNA-binding transcriptional LysR family regulator